MDVEKKNHREEQREVKEERKMTKDTKGHDEEKERRN